MLHRHLDLHVGSCVLIAAREYGQVDDYKPSSAIAMGSRSVTSSNGASPSKKICPIKTSSTKRHKRARTKSSLGRTFLNTSRKLRAKTCESLEVSEALNY